MNDMTTYNTISFAPSATREEAVALLESENYADEEQRKQLEWVAHEATDDQLNLIASYILDGDEIWAYYASELRNAIDWAYNAK